MSRDRLPYSHYPDGRIGEVFVNCENRRSERSIGLWHDIGIIVSIALQRGATLTELGAALSRVEVNYLGKIMEVPQSPCGTLVEALLDVEARHAVEGGGYVEMGNIDALAEAE